MARALAAPLKITCHGRIEEHHGLGTERAVFGGTQREHIDAALPGCLGRRAAQVHQGIGKSRPVHVHGQLEFLRGCADGGYFRTGVNRAPLRGLRQGDRAGLDVMDTQVLGIGDGLDQLRGTNLAVRRGKSDELRAAGEEAGRTGFVGDDMRRFVTINGPKAGDHLR